MIGLMPRYVPRNRKRLTFTYTRPRRRPRRKDVHVGERSSTEILTFDHGPTEFPVAVVRPRDHGSRARAAVGDLHRWFLARWAWFKPRSAPLIVATLGMLAVVWSADYLAHHLDQPTPKASHILHVDLAHR